MSSLLFFRFLDRAGRVFQQALSGFLTEQGVSSNSRPFLKCNGCGMAGFRRQFANYLTRLHLLPMQRRWYALTN